MDSSDTIGSTEALIIEASADAAKHFPALRRLLSASPGTVPVLLRIDVDGAWVTVHTGGLKVAPTRVLMEKLRREIAHGRLRRVYRGAAGRRGGHGAGPAATGDTGGRSDQRMGEG